MTAVTRLNELDAVENELENSIKKLEKAREAELDRLCRHLFGQAIGWPKK